MALLAVDPGAPARRIDVVVDMVSETRPDDLTSLFCRVRLATGQASEHARQGNRTDMAGMSAVRADDLNQRHGSSE